MKMKAWMIAAAVATCALGAQAQSDQQNKMKSCNAKAEGKAGDERKAFMKECLSAKKDGRAAQKDKMKSCNAEAKDKKGDDRRAFMKTCLSK